MVEGLSDNLASNLRRQREARGLTQQRLAELAKVPRPTIAHLESGGGNPTVGVLLKIAGVLGCSIEQLVQPAPRPAVHYPADALPCRSAGGVQVRRLVPEGTGGASLERIELGAGARYTGRAGAPAGRQCLACEAGEVQVVVGSESYRLRSGDVVVVTGGEHGLSCRNQGRRAAVVYRIALLAAAAEREQR